MNNLKPLILTVIGFGLGQPALADSNHIQKISTASSHAPISVMGDHRHKQGEWMMSYRFMRMDMDGSRIGSNRVSARDTVGTMGNPGQFLVAPTRMPMDMHMVGLMYGLSDRVTLMGMFNYVSNEMDHLVRNGRTFSTESSGLGDTKLGALIRLAEGDAYSVHLNLGVSLPTGSTDERDDTPAMQNAFLPYPMQLGSGTYDLLPGITYLGKGQTWSWGAQAAATIRTGESDQGYALGDRLALSAWLARDLSNQLSLSAGLTYQDWGNIDGRNPALNPAMVQTANTQLQGGNRLDASLGANYLFPNGHRLAIEYALPLSQSLDGPQLEIDSVLTIGWQKAF
ncbi:MAG: transporter [Pseudomonadota bacterium]